MPEHENEAPGWDAIDAALRAIYGDQEPKHYGTAIPFYLGGNDPLQGLSAYLNHDPVPHWHFVSYGLSELYQKESEDRDTSGWGIELTFRVACDGDTDEPPAWAMNFMQNLGRYVVETGNVLQPGDHMNANGPICVGSDTKLTAMCFTLDELGEINTPNGRLQFVQIATITNDELGAVMAWSTDKFVKLLSGANPRLVARLSRPSLLLQPAFAERVNRGIAEDGSSTGSLYAFGDFALTRRGLMGKKLVLTVPAMVVQVLRQVLRGRLLHGRELTLAGDVLQAQFVPAARPEIQLQGDHVRIGMPPAFAEAVAVSLEPRRGDYAWPELPGLTVRVVPTEIRDEEGNVIHVVG